MTLAVALVDTQASSVAGIIAALGTLITAVGAIYIAARQQQINHRTEETDRKVDDAGAKLEVVHTIVNQKFTDQQRYIIALREQVIRLGGEPTIDQSQPVTGQPDAQPGQALHAPPPPTAGITAGDDDRPPLVMKEVREGEPGSGL